MKNCGYLQHKRTQQNKIPQTYKFDVRVGILNNLKKKKKTEWNFILLISSYYLCAVLNIYKKKFLLYLVSFYILYDPTSYFICMHFSTSTTIQVVYNDKRNKKHSRYIQYPQSIVFPHFENTSINKTRAATSDI